MMRGRRVISYDTTRIKDTISCRSGHAWAISSRTLLRVIEACPVCGIRRTSENILGKAIRR